MKQSEITVRVDLHRGSHEASVWTATEPRLRALNADYRCLSVGGAQRRCRAPLRDDEARCYDAALPQRLNPPMNRHPLAPAFDASRVARPWSRGVHGGMGKRSLGSATAPI